MHSTPSDGGREAKINGVPASFSKLFNKNSRVATTILAQFSNKIEIPSFSASDGEIDDLVNEVVQSKSMRDKTPNQEDEESQKNKEARTFGVLPESKRAKKVLSKNEMMESMLLAKSKSKKKKN